MVTLKIDNAVEIVTQERLRNEKVKARDPLMIFIVEESLAYAEVQLSL